MPIKNAKTLVFASLSSASCACLRASAHQVHLFLHPIDMNRVQSGPVGQAIGAASISRYALVHIRSVFQQRRYTYIIHHTYAFNVSMCALWEHEPRSRKVQMEFCLTCTKGMVTRRREDGRIRHKETAPKAAQQCAKESKFSLVRTREQCLSQRQQRRESAANNQSLHGSSLHLLVEATT